MYGFCYLSAFLISHNCLPLTESKLGYLLALYSRKYSSQASNLLDSEESIERTSNTADSQQTVQCMEKEKRKRSGA